MAVDTLQRVLFPPTNRYSYLYSFDPHLSYPFLTLFQVPCAMSSRMYYRTGHR